MFSFRALLTVVVLALLSLPEGLLVHQCGCGRIFDCCCRAAVRQAAAPSCHGSRCAVGRQAVPPSSLRRGQEPVDRYGTSLPTSRPRPRALLAGRLFEESPRPPGGLAFQPPVPPPRSTGAA